MDKSEKTSREEIDPNLEAEEDIRLSDDRDNHCALITSNNLSCCCRRGFISE